MFSDVYNGDSPYNSDHQCTYYEPSQVASLMEDNSLTTISMNMRSIGNKWNEICSLIKEVNKINKVNFVTFQEIWNIPQKNLYSIEGYHL